jgi:aspartate/methionine/tyrosine aminotransferase
MTGWRIGWSVIPQEMIPNYSKLTEYNTSCVPGFVQSAARVALTQCEPDVSYLVEQIKANQTRLYECLAKLSRIELGAPAPGGMYAFFRVRGLSDSLSFCKRLVAEARLGLAPGAAFGDDSPEFVRWCIAADPARLEAGLDRFASYLSAA